VSSIRIPNMDIRPVGFARGSRRRLAGLW
jgi:hypothetical protein